MAHEHDKDTRKSGFGESPKPAGTLEFPPSSLGHDYPQHCPHSNESERAPQNLLGDAMSIAQVARMLGCSEWTVRHRYVPQGLPHFRASASGRLVFFRNQVTRWIVERQQKGGGK